MTLLIILFFASLAGIGLMIGRKLSLARAASQDYEEIFITAPSLIEIRDVASKKVKYAGLVSLVMAIRVYVKSTNFLRRTGKKVGTKIKDKFFTKEHLSTLNTEPREVSKFLKMVSEYKQKVKRIKRRIHEEEKEKSEDENQPE